MAKIEGGETMTGILETIKKTLGISKEDDSFDVDVMLCINTSLVILSQIGLSEADSKPIIDEQTTWNELLGDRTDLEIVKTYIQFRTKNMFDPPTNSALAEANNRIINELEWRIANLKLNKGANVDGPIVEE